MGGHGALTIYLNSIRKGTKQYRSCSAFAPIANPINCDWGKKAFNGYLQGGVEEAKEQYDATELISKLGGKPVHILVDYVRVFHGPYHTLRTHCLHCRAPGTTSISKANCFRRTF